MEGKTDNQNNLILGLFSKEEPCVVGPTFITDPKNGYKIIELNLKEGGTKWPNHSQKS